MAAEEFGAGEAANMRVEYDQLDELNKISYRKEKAALFVQNQAPCENMNRKVRKGKF